MEQTLSIPLYNMATSQGCSKCHVPVSAPGPPKNISLQCVANSGAAFIAIRYDELQMLGETQIHPTRLRFHCASKQREHASERVVGIGLASGGHRLPHQSFRLRAIGRADASGREFTA
eukprot:5259583-Pleurochrysis_carterae.AAC.1